MAWGYTMTFDWGDVVGSLLSVSAAFFYVIENPIAWPLSALALPVDIYLYFTKALYGDMVLQLGYLCSTLYGWYQWRFGGDAHQGVQVSRLTLMHACVLAGLASFGYVAAFKLLSLGEPTTIAFFDAITVVLSLTAQWLLCRKLIETWLVWFVVDILYIRLYFIKGLYFHSGMTLVYFCLAVSGYLVWRKQLNPSLAVVKEPLSAAQ